MTPDDRHDQNASRRNRPASVPTDDETPPDRAFPRRTLLKGFGVGAAGTSLAGCARVSSSESLPPIVGLSTASALDFGYTTAVYERLREDHPDPVTDRDKVPSVTSNLLGYDATGPFTRPFPLAVLSTPTTAGEGQWGSTTVRRSVEDLVVAVTDSPIRQLLDVLGLGSDIHGWIRKPVRIAEATSTILGTETPVESFVGVARGHEQNYAILLTLARGTTEHNAVLVGNGRERALDDASSTGSLVGPDGIFNRETVRASLTELVDVLPRLSVIDDPNRVVQGLREQTSARFDDRRSATSLDERDIFQELGVTFSTLVDVPRGSQVYVAGPVTPGTLLVTPQSVPEGTELVVPEEPGQYYLFLVDERIGSKFAHPIRYAYLDYETRDVGTVSAAWWPAIYEEGEPRTLVTSISGRVWGEDFVVDGSRYLAADAINVKENVKEAGKKIDEYRESVGEKIGGKAIEAWRSWYSVHDISHKPKATVYRLVEARAGHYTGKGWDTPETPGLPRRKNCRWADKFALVIDGGDKDKVSDAANNMASDANGIGTWLKNLSVDCRVQRISQYWENSLPAIKGDPKNKELRAGFMEILEIYADVLTYCCQHRSSAGPIDFFLYISAHGDKGGFWINTANGNGKGNFIDYENPNSTEPSLEDALKKFPDCVRLTLFFDVCNSGTAIPDLKSLAGDFQGITIVTTVNANETTPSGDLDDSMTTRFLNGRSKDHDNDGNSGDFFDTIRQMQKDSGGSVTQGRVQGTKHPQWWSSEDPNDLERALADHPLNPN